MPKSHNTIHNSIIYINSADTYVERLHEDRTTTTDFYRKFVFRGKSYIQLKSLRCNNDIMTYTVHDIVIHYCPPATDRSVKKKVKTIPTGSAEAIMRRTLCEETHVIIMVAATTIMLLCLPVAMLYLLYFHNIFYDFYIIILYCIGRY